MHIISTCTPRTYVCVAMHTQECIVSVLALVQYRYDELVLLYERSISTTSS